MRPSYTVTWRQKIKVSDHFEISTLIWFGECPKSQLKLWSIKNVLNSAYMFDIEPQRTSRHRDSRMRSFYQSRFHHSGMDSTGIGRKDLGIKFFINHRKNLWKETKQTNNKAPKFTEKEPELLWLVKICDVSCYSRSCYETCAVTLIIQCCYTVRHLKIVISEKKITIRVYN